MSWGGGRVGARKSIRQHQHRVKVAMHCIVLVLVLRPGFSPSARRRYSEYPVTAVGALAARKTALAALEARKGGTARSATPHSASPVPAAVTVLDGCALLLLLWIARLELHGMLRGVLCAVRPLLPGTFSHLSSAWQCL